MSAAERDHPIRQSFDACRCVAFVFVTACAAAALMSMIPGSAGAGVGALFGLMLIVLCYDSGQPLALTATAAFTGGFLYQLLTIGWLFDQERFELHSSLLAMMILLSLSWPCAAVLYMRAGRVIPRSLAFAMAWVVSDELPRLIIDYAHQQRGCAALNHLALTQVDAIGLDQLADLSGMSIVLFGLSLSAATLVLVIRAMFRREWWQAATGSVILYCVWAVAHHRSAESRSSPTSIRSFVITNDWGMACSSDILEPLKRDVSDSSIVVWPEASLPCEPEKAAETIRMTCSTCPGVHVIGMERSNRAESTF